ncbi:hypothetical protein A4G99_19090 [Haladaptatus sp. R4]|nr:hypothetical protein A4G99_19090 [Haladaptatus sp. R4]
MAAVIEAEQPQKDTERAVGDLLGNDSPRHQLVGLIDDGGGRSSTICLVIRLFVSILGRTD